MTLTQQFLIIAILPLSFLGMIVYLWRAPTRRRQLFGNWSLALLAAAVWSSSVLRLFGGVRFSPLLIYNWRIIGYYALGIHGLLLLSTTIAYLSPPRRHGRLALGLSLALWLLALLLDADMQILRIPEFSLSGQFIRQFDIWAAVWVVSWLVPLMGAWLLTQQLNSTLPNSQYRNQVQYWLLVLSLSFAAFTLASVQQPGQPGWQQSGVLVTILAAAIGTITFTQRTLPDLQLAARQILSRLAGTLVLFALTWWVLSVIVQAVADLEGTTNSAQDLILLLAAALFAGLFTLIYRFVNDFMRRIFLPSRTRQETIMADYAQAIGNLPEPEQLGQLFLRILQTNLSTDDAWFFVADNGPGGRLIFRPLTAISDPPRETMILAADSPLGDHLRHQDQPLVQYDIDTLDNFANLDDDERSLLEKWQRVLFKPLRAGENLVGMIALGKKFSGESYNQQDFALLNTLGKQVAPLLVQAQNLASLRRINEYTFAQNQALARDKRHLLELVQLYQQFLNLVSPDLRRPFTTIHKTIQEAQTEHKPVDVQDLLRHLNQQILTVSDPLDNLITMSTRIQKRHSFSFTPLNMEEIAQNAIRNLRAMAEARRISVEYKSKSALATVLGDESQLLEATQHLLHNAIKFNKIGGVVEIGCGVEGTNVFLQITDYGVGMPAERVEHLWDGFQRNGRLDQSRQGMGLILARFIIQSHGGALTVESKHGAGSTFTLFLPLLFPE